MMAIALAARKSTIIECKTTVNEDDLATEAQTALQQIKDRDYDAELRAQGMEQILHYGIAFCAKKVQVNLEWGFLT